MVRSLTRSARGVDRLRAGRVGRRGAGPADARAAADAPPRPRLRRPPPRRRRARLQPRPPRLRPRRRFAGPGPLAERAERRPRPRPPPRRRRPTPGATSGDSGSMGETIDLTPRPAAYLDGKAGRDEVYSAIIGAIGTVRAEVAKAGLKPAGPSDRGLPRSRRFRLQVPRCGAARRGARRQDPTLRRGEDRPDAGRQGDAIRASRRL